MAAGPAKPGSISPSPGSFIARDTSDAGRGPAQSAAEEKARAFLRSIRGMGKLSAQALEHALYAGRFDLIEGIAATAGAAGVAPGAATASAGDEGDLAVELEPFSSGAELQISKSESRRSMDRTSGEQRFKLPPMATIPSAFELLQMIRTGALPASNQCVAHVLYPEAVPWPFPWDEDDPEAQDSLTKVISEEGPKKPRRLSQVRRSSGGRRSSTGRRGSLGKDSRGSVFRTASMERLMNSGSTRRRLSARHDTVPLADIDLDVPCPEADSGVAGRPSVGPAQNSLEDQGEVVLICGQVLRSTVRGRELRLVPVVEGSETNHFLTEQETIEQRLQAEVLATARKQEQLQKSLEMELFQERRAAEQLRSFEEARAAELEKQKEMQLREARRQKRREELRAEFDRQLERKMAEEKAQKEQEEKDKELAQREEEKRRKEQKQRKEELAAWYSERDQNGTASQACAEVRQRLERERLEKREESERRRAEQRTLKQRRTDDQLERCREALEERPPVPPRPHDLPVPAVAMARGIGISTGSDDGRSRSSGAESARGPRASSLEVQVRKLSGKYGLTQQDRGQLEQLFSRQVRGAGRMAEYEK